MAPDVDDHHVTFLRDGATIDSVSVSPSQSLLAATDDTNFDARYGCREGNCVSCIGRLVEGSVGYFAAPTALSEPQRAAGFVLLCVAYPESDCRIEIGRSVLEAAFPELWRTESGIR